MFVVGSAGQLWVDDDRLAATTTGSVPVLLLAPADMPGVFWPAPLLEWFDERGVAAVRYDQRDTGRSDVAAQEYSLRDLAADAVAVLDALEIERAHAMGLSMGGMVAQVLALDFPERVHSLTLVATTPGLGDPRLPGPAGHIVQELAKRIYAGPPTEPDELVDWLLAGRRLFAGPRFAHRDGELPDQVRAIVAAGWRAETGHGAAVVNSASRLDRLGEISVPTTVVHGTADNVFTVEHGLALADGISGAELILIEGMGHEFPAELIESFVASLERLLSATSGK
ncbi:MAG: alpha/beta fold hydrolase [Acidimicrobiales bacterium]|nr:alpha/beta fold hydrolase [Acidimicrobiales bacterium]